MAWLHTAEFMVAETNDPVDQAYRRGWNDCRTNTLRKIKECPMTPNDEHETHELGGEG